MYFCVLWPYLIQDSLFNINRSFRFWVLVVTSRWKYMNASLFWTSYKNVYAWNKRTYFVPIFFIAFRLLKEILNIGNKGWIGFPYFWFPFEPTHFRFHLIKHDYPPLSFIFSRSEFRIFNIREFNQNSDIESTNTRSPDGKTDQPTILVPSCQEAAKESRQAMNWQSTPSTAYQCRFPYPR